MTPMQSGFYIKVNDRLQRFAEQLGFTKGDWRQSVLDDILHDGKLRGELRRDPKSSLDSWWFYGRNITAQCAPDSYSEDTLFAVGLYPGPLRNGRKPGPSTIDIPGPWRLATFTQKSKIPVTLPVEEHLRRTIDSHRRPARPTPLSNHPGPPSPEEPPKPLASTPPPATTDAPTPAHPPAAPGSTPLLADERSLRDQWSAAILAERIARSPSLAGLLDAPDIIEARASRLESLATAKAKISTELSELHQRIQHLESRLGAIQSDIDGLPSIDALQDLRDQLDDLRALGEQTGRPPPPKLPEEEALRAQLADCALLATAQLPPWILTHDVGQLIDQSLGAAQGTDAVSEIARWIRSLAEEGNSESLPRLPDPALAGSPLIVRLKAAWANHQLRQSIFEDLPAAARPAADAIALADAQEVVVRLLEWQDSLSTDAFTDLVARLQALGSERWLQETPTPPPLTEDDRRVLRYIPDYETACSLAQRLTPLPRRTSLAAEAPQPRATAKVEILDFGHALTNEQGHVVAAMIAPPLFQLGDRTSNIQVPVRIKLSQQPGDTVLTVQVNSADISTLPEQNYSPNSRVESVDGRRTLIWNIPVSNDTCDTDGRAFSTDQILSVPVTRRSFGDLLNGRDLKLRLSAGSTASATLTFNRVLQQPPGSPKIDNSEDPRTMIAKHALGVQTLHTQLEEHVRDGGISFMVAAPRRFGKTTLLQYIAQAAESRENTVVVVAHLDRNQDPAESVRTVFVELDKTLRSRFQASPLTEGDVAIFDPDRDTFSRVRTFLGKNGASGLVLLIDEAQSLVPRHRSEWGNRLKRLIETAFTVPTSGAPRVMLGLFGTNDLGLKLGPNCRDFLSGNGGEILDFEERSLARFLREIGGSSLESTARARVELARWTGNLWTLKRVLRSLVQRLESEHRTFFLDTDVQSSVRDLLRSDSGVVDSIWSYASSELSNSDTWDPIDSFPLAVAWAWLQPTGLLDERLSSCQEWLQKEAEQHGTQGSIARERIALCLDDLKGRGIIREDGSFRRPILRELLRLRAKDLFKMDPKNSLALQRLVVDLIPWPQSATPCGEGAQARIFITGEADPPRAIRLCDLTSEQDRHRFIRTCTVLRRVRPVSTRHRGDAFLPRIRAAGFLTDNPSQGAVIYDWIPGNSLDGQWRGLSLDARVRIAEQVVQALEALHERRIVHCDVRPRNIIVDGALTAHLIDFGLSRGFDDETRTKMGEDSFSAPELRDGPTTLSPAVDIYALGAFLLGGAHVDDQSEEQALALRMMAADPAQRPTASEVARSLEEISRRIDMQHRITSLASRIEALIMVVCDRHEWLLEPLLGYRQAAIAQQANLLPWDENRMLETAFYANNIFACCLRKAKNAVFRELLASAGPDLSLANVRSKVRGSSAGLAQLGIWTKPHVHVTGLFRLAWAHPEKRSEFLKDARRDLNLGMSDTILVPGTASVRATIHTLDTSLDVEGALTGFFDCLLPPQPGMQAVVASSAPKRPRPSLTS